MTQGKGFFENLQKMADCALSSATQAKEAAVEFMKGHIDSLMKSKYLVSREEFEALKATVEKMQNHTHEEECSAKPQKCESKKEEQMEECKKESHEECEHPEENEKNKADAPKKTVRRTKKATDKLDA